MSSFRKGSINVLNGKYPVWLRLYINDGYSTEGQVLGEIHRKQSRNISLITTLSGCDDFDCDHLLTPETLDRLNDYRERKNGIK